MSESPDCSCFAPNSRSLEICEGRSELGIGGANRLRARRGIALLPDDGAAVHIADDRRSTTRAVRTTLLPVSHATQAVGGCCGGEASPKPTVPRTRPTRGPGSRLIELFKSKGFETCPACYELADRMDGWGTAGCLARIDEIVADILPRALAWEQEKLAWFAKLIPEKVTSAAIRALVMQVVEVPTKKRSGPAARRVRGPQAFHDRKAKLIGATFDPQRDGDSPTAIDDLRFRQSVCKTCAYNVHDICKLCNSHLNPTPLERGKLHWRAESCPAGRWFAQTGNRRPLVNPMHSLIFHIYPKRGAEWNWHWHCEQIRKHAPLFNGHIAIGIVTDHTTARVEDVQQQLTGVPISHWVLRANSKLAETLTHVDLLRCVQTGDPNAIVFRFHTKGVTKRPDGIEQKWARLLWQTAMDIESIHDALASHLVCGAMRSRDPLVKPKENGDDFFFAGSAYWMRAAEVFQRDWQHVDHKRWWVEYFPNHIFTFQESACLCHDFAESSVLSEQYFNEVVEPDWMAWRMARGLGATS